uniref:Uncharacterized protein n=1 Tax=Candidatus Kentrum sp. LFY TaxID=2126342 RepID=A0A450U6T3_9GAMM|nr:MAG: hypothetical protein BECKLFY1418A_GA0070994_100181 [Candidatus Kentron sp. LFY]
MSNGSNISQQADRFTQGEEGNSRWNTHFEKVARLEEVVNSLKETSATTNDITASELRTQKEISTAISESEKKITGSIKDVEHKVENAIKEVDEKHKSFYRWLIGIIISIGATIMTVGAILYPKLQ